MIDTSKYEGHSPAPWQPWKNKRTIEVVRSQLAEKPVVCKVLNECDAQLIADAPLLLAEVKRLREAIVGMIDSMDNRYIRDVQHAAGCLRDLMGYYDEEE